MKRAILPSLNGLRAFEAAARYGSLSEASDELGVTPSAVGHQIRALEKNLGVRLFDRQAKRLSLTQTGHRYAGALTQGFDVLHRATESVRRQQGGRAITVRATPAMALRWLAPALDRLRHEGQAEFRIDASSQEADLAAGEADIDIRYGRAIEPGLVAEVLFHEHVFPLCTLDVARRHDLPNRQDLSGVPLLFVDDWGYRGGVWSAWDDWGAEAGYAPEMFVEARRYTELDHAVKAAAQGEGVAMGAERHLRAYPDLAPAFPDAPGVTYGIFLVALPEVAEDPVIRRLTKRLVALAGERDDVLHAGAF